MAVSLQRLTGEGQEIAAVQRVLEGARSYAERVTGHPPGHGDAQRLFSIVPEGVDYENKFVWGVLAAGEMVGVVDVIRGWPNPDTALLGLLLLTDAYGGRGLGRRAYAAVEEQVRSWLDTGRCGRPWWPPTRQSCRSGSGWGSRRPVRSGRTGTTS